MIIEHYFDKFSENSVQQQNQKTTFFTDKTEYTENTNSSKILEDNLVRWLDISQIYNNFFPL